MISSNLPRKLRHAVAERDSYTCVLCYFPYSDVHHVIPRSRGGTSTMYNLVSLCREHHGLVHGETHNLGTMFTHDAEVALHEYIERCYGDDPEYWRVVHGFTLDDE